MSSLQRCSSMLLVAMLPLLVPPLARADATVAQRAVKSVVTVIAGSTEGTAFAYGHADTLLTNAHVVGGSSSVEVITADGVRVAGRVVALDAAHDLALIQAPVQLAPLAVRAAAAQPGEPVLAIGAPLGLQGSIANGVVSAIRPGQPSDAAIQTDVPLNPGDSGGPLLDSQGRVLGINQSHLQNASGISFAIPIADAAGLQPGGVPRQSGRSADSTLLIGGVAVALVVAFPVLGLAIARRRRRLPIELRPAAESVRYEPEPRVRLRSGEE